MKNACLFVLCFLLFGKAFSQNIIPSNCHAPDSVKALYEDDANTLAVRWINKKSNPYKDSVRINDSISGKFLNALLAVYNVENMHARDTVVQKFKIHSFCNIQLHEILVYADSNAAWMRSLRQNQLPTGNQYIDSLFREFNLTVKNYSPDAYYRYDRASLKSKKAYNTTVLSEKFEQADSVDNAFPNFCISDGNNITGNIYDNYTELIYTYAWGDCLAGCIYERFWKFRVYEDCGVEFVESYGDKYTNVSLPETALQNISVYPNPFINMLVISGINAPFQYSISNVLGQTVAKGNADSNTINGLENLEKGMYFMHIKAGVKTGNFKILKN